MMGQRSFDWLQLALLVASVQGLLLAVALATHPARRAANRLLAALMAACSVSLASTVYYSAGFVADHPHLFGLSYPLTWVYAPIVYLYAVTASDVDRGMRRRDWLHFLPPVLVVLANLPIYLMSGPEKVALFERMEAGEVPRLLALIDPTKYLSGIAYSAATVLHLRRHRRRVELSYSSTEHVTLRWLLWLTGASVAIWLLAVGIELAEVLPQLDPDDRGDPVSLAVAILIYAIGYAGLRQPEIHRYELAGAPVAVEEESPAEDEGAEQRVATAPAAVAEPGDERRERSEPDELLAGDARYVRSGLGAAEAVRLKGALLALMERERPYRDPELTLADLAARLDTTPHRLSQVLNGELAQTFYDFVNGYRIDDVRRRLAEPDANRFNVLTIALDAGFSSKSTFNQAFKKFTGQTPSTYRKALAG